MKRIVLFTGFAFFVLFSNAQYYSLKGTLRDKNEGISLPGATIHLSSVADTTVNINGISGKQGVFEIKQLISRQYLVNISMVGYEPIDTVIQISGSSLNLGVLSMVKKASLLSEVIVQAAAPPVKQKQDTLEYSASAYKVNPDASAEDMVKKMPGITIEQGTVKAAGEDVKKVTIDGRDFFGDDATAALRNLPAEVIDKIQVFDRLSDQAQFTGFDDGNTAKSINVVTKANMRNGQFGRVYAGYGTDGRYAAGGNVSFFNGDRRLSLVGLTNNVNQQNFATEDLLGVTSQGGGRGRGGRGRGGRGGRGGGGGRGFGGSGNFLVGQQGGISKTNSFGLNYSDLWGPKVTVSGSYFFNNSNNSSDEITNRQYFLNNDSSQLYKENSVSSSENYNHRFNLRIEYKIDSFNSILFTPSLSLQKNSSFSSVAGMNNYEDGAPISQSLNENTRQSSGYNFNNGVLYRHAFAKRGRTISLGINAGLNQKSGETWLNAVNRYYKAGSDLDDSLQQFSDQFGNGKTISVNVAYTEPVGKSGQLQFNYNPSFSQNKSDQQTFQFDGVANKYSLFDSSLSNKFSNNYNTQSGGVSYRIGNRDNMFSLGLSYQRADLDSKQTFPFEATVSRTFANLLPNAMWRARLSPKSSIRLFYRSSTDAPSISQLQDVINNSNPLFLSTGNPDLNQSFTHRLATRYTYTNSSKGQTFFANIYAQKTDDYVADATYTASRDSIISNTITLFRGSQLTKPVNLNGYWSVRSFFTFGMPIKLIKSNLNWNAGYSYSRSPGLINNVSNISNAQNYNIGAVLASNVSEYIDFTLSYSANFNIVKNSIQPELNDNYFSQVAGIQVNLLSKNGWVFQNDLNNQAYRGLTDGFNQNFWLWNISVGKKFLKKQKGELRLSVFDLLKQNRSISRDATETYIEDVQTKVLQQYFMLTFSYRLRNFGSRK